MTLVLVLFLWTRRGAWCLVLKEGADGVSGATDEEGGSCLEVLGERTKRKGVWLVISLDVKEMEWLVDETSGGGLLCPWFFPGDVTAGKKPVCLHLG